MNKHIKRVIFDTILIIFTSIIGFFILRSFVLKNYYVNSILFIYYTFMILLIITLFINIGRIFLTEKHNKKYLSIFLPTILSIGFYYLLKNNLHLSLWGTTTTYPSIYQEFMDFYDGIYNLLILDNNLFNMILYGNLFSVGITLLYFLQNKLHGIVGYVTERIIRLFFTLTPIFLFIIFVYQLPYTFYYPRGLQYLSIFLFFFIIGVAFYILFISLLEIHKLNQSVINKETLLVIMNQDNYSTKTIGLFKNPLSYFRQYNIDNFLNSLVIRSKNYTLVSFDAIRYGLIKKSYKNIGYLYLISNKQLSNMNNSLWKDYYEYLEMMMKKEKHFVFLIFDEGNRQKKITDKYRYQSIDKINMEDIIRIVYLTKEEITLHDEVYQLLQTIPKNHPFSYIHSSLEKILHCYDDVEILYSLLKIGEYVVHYRALKNIVANNEIVKNVKSIIQPSFGVWATLQNVDTVYTNREVIVARDNLIDKLERPATDKDRKEVTFLYLINLLVTTRNKYLGHGSISNKIARTYNHDIFIIIKVLVEEFKNMNMDIKEDCLIKNLFEKDIYAIKYRNNQLYLYMNNLFDKTEYLDYKEGKIYIADNDNKIYLNKKEEEYEKVTNN